MYEKPEVPIYKRVLLTLEEASAYSGLGINKVRSLMDEPDCPFVLHNATRRMIKRKPFEKYLLEEFSI